MMHNIFRFSILFSGISWRIVRGGFGFVVLHAVYFASLLLCVLETIMCCNADSYFRWLRLPFARYLFLIHVLREGNLSAYRTHCRCTPCV